MDYQGIIITGTSGSGKTTVAKAICNKSESFKIVKATTTRSQREDDFEGQYNYVEKKDFEELTKKKQFLVKSQYRGAFYGIAKTEIDSVVNEGKIPILIITPDSMNQNSTHKKI